MLLVRALQEPSIYSVEVARKTAQGNPYWLYFANSIIVSDNSFALVNDLPSPPPAVVMLWNF